MAKKTVLPEEISLRMDLDRVTLNDLIVLEDQKATARQIRDFLARCAVDSEGNSIGMEKAVEIVGNLPISKIRELASGIAEHLREVGQVPPEKDRR